MNRESHDIREVRSRICNVFLVVLGIAAVPALAASLYRITVTGWLPIMAVQIGLFVALFFVILFRKHLPYNLRAGFIIAGILTLGIGGLWQLGLLGSAIVFLVVAPATGAIFFGTRVGVAILVVTILSMGIIGAHALLEHRLPVVDPSFYVTQPSAWFSGLLGSALVAGVLLAALVMYNRGLGAALKAASQHDEALRESEARFRTLVEYAPEAITIIDVDTGLYVDANPMAETLYGRKRDELIGKISPADPSLSPEIQVDGRPSSEAAQDYLNRALAGEFPRFEWMHLDPDGQETLCEVSLARLPDPHRNLVSASIYDINERKRAEGALRESERRLSKAAEMAKIGYWVWDEVEDKAIYCSEEMAKMYSVAFGDELMAKLSSHEADVEWVHRDDRERFERAVRAAQETKGGYEIEHRIINAAGEVRYLYEIEEPVLDERGNIIRSNGITLDITEQKRAEEQLRQAQKMEAVGQLTGGVAHDFNNLLAIILGNLELAESNLAGGDTRNHVEKAIEATERGARLTQRLLAFSRKQALRPALVDARKLIDGMLDMLRRSLGETVEIEIVTDAGLWATEIDPGQLEGALLNLAINARDAMPDGGKLTIEASNARLTDDYAAAQIDVEPGQYVLVSVSDTGTGMAPEVREQVFDPFFTTKETGKGTGLGLSMVYGFVKQSGGHVQIYSEVGEGTTIKLYLPRYRGTKAAAERGGKADEVALGKGEVILVVEDDVDLRTMVINMLQSLGYRVLEARTAKRALEVLGETPSVNLLLTDVVLPGEVSGRALADQLQQKIPDLPVVYMSGYTENAVIHHWRLDQGVQLLEKPFRKADLARNIRRALERESA